MAISFTLMMWLGIASQMAKANGYIHNQMKPLSVENCPYFFNVTSEIIPSDDTPKYDVKYTSAKNTHLNLFTILGMTSFSY